MNLLADADTKRPIQSIFNDLDFVLSPVIQGEKVPVTVRAARRIPNPNNSRFFNPIDLSLWEDFRVAIGDRTALPVAGVGYIETEDGDTVTFGPAPSAAEMQAALNGALATEAEVTVVEHSDNYFVATHNNNGVRELFIGRPEGYAPLSVIETGFLIEGSVDARAVQFIRIHQAPAAYANLVDNLPAAAVNVEVLQTGGVGQNHKIRITLTEGAFDGKFTLAIGGQESGFIGYDEAAAEFQATLEAMTSVGTGNVTVVRETVSQWVAMFIGAKAATDMGAITGDASALFVPIGKSGYIDMRVPGVQLLLNGAPQVEAIFEVEATPSGGAPQKLIQDRITVVEGLIDQATAPVQPIPGATTTGSVGLTAGSSSVAVVFPTAMGTAPAKINITLAVPNGEGVFTIAIRKGSVTAAGFTVDFGGAPDSNNYEILYEATI